VSLASLEFGELARAGFAALVSFAGAYAAITFIPRPAGHTGDFLGLAVGTLCWAVLGAATLQFTGSRLLHQLRNRNSPTSAPARS